MQQIISFWNFLVIHNFSGFTTLLASSVAWIVYSSQKKDKKVNAATVILSEIRLAEDKIDQIKGLLERKAKDFPRVLPVNSWKIYSYLFASDFDEDQLKEINSFYNICEVMEEAAKRDSNYFWLTSEYITHVGQTVATELIQKSLKEDFSLDEEKLIKLRTSILDNVAKYPFIYSPQKTIDTLTFSVSDVKKITTSTTGTKLKELAQVSGKKSYLKFFRIT